MAVSPIFLLSPSVPFASRRGPRPLPKRFPRVSGARVSRGRFANSNARRFVHSFHGTPAFDTRTLLQSIRETLNV